MHMDMTKTPPNGTAWMEMNPGNIASRNLIPRQREYTLSRHALHCAELRKCELSDGPFAV